MKHRTKLKIAIAIIFLIFTSTTFATGAGVIAGVKPGFFINERSAKFLGNLDSGLTERGQRVIDHTPMQRFGYPEDLLGCVRFLLDDRASGFVTGITVAVDGGFLAHPGI